MNYSLLVVFQFFKKTFLVQKCKQFINESERSSWWSFKAGSVLKSWQWTAKWQLVSIFALKRGARTEYKRADCFTLWTFPLSACCCPLIFDTTHLSAHMSWRQLGSSAARQRAIKCGQDSLCLHNSLGAASPSLSLSGVILFNLMLVIHLSYIALDSHLAVAWNREEGEEEETVTQVRKREEKMKEGNRGRWGEVIREEILEKRAEVKGPNTLRLLSNDPAAN